jgi:dienelactone hydrolase
MAQVLLFHHAQGRTTGIGVFADALRQAGHTVHTPDLFGGRTFGTLEEGVGYAEEVGFSELLQRGVEAAEALPGELVYAGFSLGVLPAQKLAQTRPGARGALLVSACVPRAEFGPWPAGVSAQIHAMADDPIVVGDGDLEAARELVAAGHGELFLYPGSEHLFADSSLPGYEAAAAASLTERVLDFLTRT